jgi:TetR/AcrR family transcriptional repressor of nem operon
MGGEVRFNKRSGLRSLVIPFPYSALDWVGGIGGISLEKNTKQDKCHIWIVTNVMQKTQISCAMLIRPTCRSYLAGRLFMELKDRIYHESLRLFSEKGFLNTSISDILEATGSSKGGFYNHFSSKDELFYEVLAIAQSIWREKVLYGVDEVESPTAKIKLILENYRNRYLKDYDNFPGGCIFVTFSVELDDQRPDLMQEVAKGFVGLKNMLRNLLEEGKAKGELRQDVNTNRATELIFSGMIGSSVLFGSDKSNETLDRSINSLILYLDGLAPDESLIDISVEDQILGI